MSAPFPLGEGVSEGLIETAQIADAMNRQASATVSFEIDEHGTPGHFQVETASQPDWGTEAIGIVKQWRFTPGMGDGSPVPVPCTLDLVRARKETDH